MRYVFLAAALAVAASGPVAAQPQQLLQGLLNGNGGNDQAVREAYERGYQRGREDEARMRDRRGPPPPPPPPGYDRPPAYGQPYGR